MTAHVETMAYTNEVPWHGLGTKVDGKQSVKQMLKAAGLDWKVERRAMCLKVDTAKGNGSNVGDEIPGFAALVRDKDNQVFDIVGSQYRPTQNEQAFEFFNEFIKAGKATMETAGSLRGGRYVWGLANLGTSFKLRGDDVVKSYLLCACPHQQGKSMIFKFTSVRVVCNNTLTMALGEIGTEHRHTHRSEFNDAAIEKAKDRLGIAREQMGQFEKIARKLQGTKLKREKIIDVLAPLFAPKIELKIIRDDFDANATPKLKDIMGALEKAPGAQPDNAWGVLNAVTYWADHMASRTPDKRLTNAWLGKTAVQKEKVLDALLEL
jgi:phage/plasmid-like protein (TIGR03299 family)